MTTGLTIIGDFTDMTLVPGHVPDIFSFTRQCYVVNEIKNTIISISLTKTETEIEIVYKTETR